MTEKIIEKRLQFLEENKNRLIIDGDTHISDPVNQHLSISEKIASTPNYYHGRPISAEDLLKEMKLAGVDMALVWQNPAATVYPGNEEGNFRALLAANEYIFKSAEKYPGRFIPAGWTDPKALGKKYSEELIQHCVRELGFPIVKMNPAQNAFPIDSDMVAETTEIITSLGAIPAFHFGADTPYTPAEGLGKLADQFPESPIIAVHMGGGGASYTEAEELYQKARQIGLEKKNIYYVFSAKRDTHIESDLITYRLSGRDHSGRLMCASDAPYGKQAWNFGGFRAMFDAFRQGDSHPDKRLNENPGIFDEEDFKGFLGRNLAELSIEGYKSILKKMDN